MADLLYFCTFGRKSVVILVGYVLFRLVVVTFFIALLFHIVFMAMTSIQTILDNLSRLFFVKTQISVKSVLSPVLVNSWLAVQWDNYLLAADRAHEKAEDLSEDDVENSKPIKTDNTVNENLFVPSLRAINPERSQQDEETKETSSPLSEQNQINRRETRRWSSKLSTDDSASTFSILPEAQTSTSVTPESFDERCVETKENSRAPRRLSSLSTDSAMSVSILPEAPTSTFQTDTNPRWNCACGYGCLESSRRDHLKVCDAFKRAWRDSLETLLRIMSEHRELLKSSEEEDDIRDNSDRSGDSCRLDEPLTLEERLAKLGEYVAHSEDSSVAASCGTASSSFRMLRSRGMLLASLVESGGNWKKAAAKLCQKDSKLKLEAISIAFRSEMEFVAEHVQLEALLVENTESLRDSAEYSI